MIQRIKIFCKEVTRRILELFGFELVRKDAAKENLYKYIWSPLYKYDDRMHLYFEGLKKSGVEWSDNLPKQFRFYSLQQIVELVARKNLPGDVVECGCWKGHSTYIISSILKNYGFAQYFHVFDAFEGGLSEKTARDINETRELTERELDEENSNFRSTEEEVNRTVSEFDFVKLYKGWIPERFNEVEETRVAFLHVDVDLYQPTLDSLNFFYRRIINGGAIVVDDYGLTQFAGCKAAVDDFLSVNECSLFYEIPLGGCFILK